MTLNRNDVALPADPFTSGRSQWNRLRFARIGWIVLALMLMAYRVANVPIAYQAALTVCTPSDTKDCSNALVTAGNVQALAQQHLSVAAYVGFLVAFGVATSLLAWAVCVLIFLRGSREWTGLFFSLLLVFVSSTEGASVLAGIAVTAQTPLLVQLLVAVSGVLAAVQSAAIAALFLTFPNGRLIPRWSMVLILLAFVAGVLPPSPNPAVNAVETFAWLLPNVGMLGVQVYRYARVYDTVQRQQAKWFVFALGVAISILVITSVPGLVVPSLGAPDSWYQLFGNAISPLVGMLVISSVGIAVLRFRLWDIDVLVNRALVYASLTALLAGLYVGLVLGLQAAVHATTGSLSDQPLVLVGSTLAIAALFQPLRRRIQATIDGRFYRRKYDAAKVVAAFSSTLRQEVDLDQLREQMVAVVQETMQPRRVSLWLRPPDQERKHGPRK